MLKIRIKIKLFILLLNLDLQQYQVQIRTVKLKKMGNMCNSQNEELQPRKSIRKISNASRENVKTVLENSDIKINLQSLRDKIRNSCQVINVEKDIEIISQLGKGGQADVFQVRFSNNFIQGTQNLVKKNDTFALKRIYKNSILNRRESIEVGKDILMGWECPFIMNGIMLYEDEHYLYEVMENATGGDISTFLSTNSEKGNNFRQLGEEGIRFILAGIVLGLQHLHKNNIIYCDMKLENILIGSDGYPILTDFEMAEQGRFIKSQGYRGTVSYIAPDLFVDQSVDRAMDLWALGILIYALVYGETPYANQKVYSLQYVAQCTSNEGKYKRNKRKTSENLTNLINSLLKVNPKQRLGYCNFSQIKKHAFFKGFDWYKYNRKELASPLFSIVEKFQKLRKTEVQKQNQAAPRNMLKKSARKGSADKETECDEFVAKFSELQA